MAAKNEKRSPTAHRTPSQIKNHGRGYQAQPAQKKNRAKRNAARKVMAKKGQVRKGDGKDVDHKRPLIAGGSNSPKNLAVRSRKVNRGHAKKG